MMAYYYRKQEELKVSHAVIIFRDAPMLLIISIGQLSVYIISIGQFLPFYWLFC